MRNLPFFFLLSGISFFLCLSVQLSANVLYGTWKMEVEPIEIIPPGGLPPDRQQPLEKEIIIWHFEENGDLFTFQDELVRMDRFEWQDSVLHTCESSYRIVYLTSDELILEPEHENGSPAIMALLEPFHFLRTDRIPQAILQKKAATAGGFQKPVPEKTRPGEMLELLPKWAPGDKLYYDFIIGQRRGVSGVIIHSDTLISGCTGIEILEKTDDGYMVRWTSTGFLEGILAGFRSYMVFMGEMDEDELLFENGIPIPAGKESLREVGVDMSLDLNGKMRAMHNAEGVVRQIDQTIDLAIDLIGEKYEVDPNMLKQVFQLSEHAHIYKDPEKIEKKYKATVDQLFGDLGGKIPYGLVESQESYPAAMVTELLPSLHQITAWYAITEAGPEAGLVKIEGKIEYDKKEVRASLFEGILEVDRELCRYNNDLEEGFSLVYDEDAGSLRTVNRLMAVMVDGMLFETFVAYRLRD